jgi:hypothetical protein
MFPVLIIIKGERNPVLLMIVIKEEGRIKT